MDEAMQVMRRFIDAEFEAVRAGYVDPDNDAVRAKEKGAEKFFHITPQTPMALGFGRGSATPEDLKDGERFLNRIKPRTLFQVKHYRHPELGELHRFYASPWLVGYSLGYGSSFFVAKVDGEWKIVSRYAPARGGEKVEWEHESGMRLTTLGELTGTEKLTPPERAAHLADYEDENAGNW